MCGGGPSTELRVWRSRREACVDVGAVEVLGLGRINVLCVDHRTVSASDDRQSRRTLALWVVDLDDDDIPCTEGVHD